MTEYAFTLGGAKFRGKPLAPDTSLDVFAVVAPCFGEVFEAIDMAKLQAEGDQLAAITAAISKALRQFGALRTVAKDFAKVYEIELGGSWLSVDTFRKEAFEGKPALQVSWLVGAVVSEYRDFLGPGGWSTLADLGGLFGFRITLPNTGQSGG